MTNKELQQLLAQYPDDVTIRTLHTKSIVPVGIKDLSEENILLTSEEAFIDESADPQTWDCEDGKIVHKGNKYLLLNALIY